MKKKVSKKTNQKTNRTRLQLLLLISLTACLFLAVFAVKQQQNVQSEAAINSPFRSRIVLKSISPSTANFGNEITLSGSRFTAKQGSVNFYNPDGSLAGGAPIVYWSNTVIKATIPAVKGHQRYSVEVITGSGEKSNRLAFTVNYGQPVVWSVSPLAGGPGKQIMLTGADFGPAKGEVNWYLPGSSSPSGGSVVYSWTDTEIRANVPGILAPNREYVFVVKTSDGRTSSVKYYTVGK